MSITKSLTALLLGRAIQMGHLNMEDLDRPLVEFFELGNIKLAAGADSITLGDALNMSSGIRIADPARQKILQRQLPLAGQQELETYFSQTKPISAASKKFKYQSYDPSIVMQAIERIVPGTAESFLEKQLLEKLAIRKFGWRPNASGLPKSAAGSSLCSRDMVKFGLMVANQGVWNGEQLIPPEYVEKMTSRIHTNAQQTSYGYFWWRHDMKVGPKKVDCISARGAGGQFIMLYPELDLIIVVTAHDKGMVGKMLLKVPQHVLPSFVDQATTPAGS